MTIPSEHAPPLSVAYDVTAVPAEPVGAGRYTIELARALVRSGEASMTFLSRRDDVARWRTLSGSDGASGRVAAVAPGSRPLRLAYGELALGRRAERLRPPVEVFHGPHYQLPRRLALPSVVTVHDLTFVEHPEWHEPKKVLFFRQALRRSASRARVVICVSERTKERFLEHFSPEGEVLTVAHGIDHARFHAGATSEDASVLAALGVRRPYVLHLGTIEPRKNVPALIRAFADAARYDSELSLVLAGRFGWGGDEFQAAIVASGISERIVALGYVEGSKVPALLRGATAVAYPSLEEGFGLPALEALACGAPLVTTEGSVMAELANKAALLVPPGDEDALAGALRELIEGGAAVDARRREGIARASAYTWERSGAGHLRAYQLAAADCP